MKFKMAPRKFDDEASEAMSKTTAYRKVIKPRIEKKRRDKQNGYIDELRDLIIASGQERDKMEKTRVLEVAVKFVREARAREAEMLRAALSLAMSEVSRSLAVHGVEVTTGNRVLSGLGATFHLATATLAQPRLQLLDNVSHLRPPQSRILATSPSVSSDASSDFRDLSPSPSRLSTSSPSSSPSSEPVWRPF